MAKRLGLTLPVLAAFLFMGFVNQLSAAEIEIVAAITDYDSGQLTIKGSGLSDVDAPIVELGGFVLTITSWGENEIIAEINSSNYVLGDYLLVVDPNYKKVKKVQMMITLGAEGPSNPGYYYLYTNGLIIPANGQIKIAIRCHDDDFAIHAQEFTAGREETPLGYINEFYVYSTVAVNATSSPEGITMLLSCLEFSRPFHEGDWEEAFCVENQYHAGSFYCESSEH